MTIVLEELPAHKKFVVKSSGYSADVEVHSKVACISFHKPIHEIEIEDFEKIVQEFVKITENHAKYLRIRAQEYKAREEGQTQ